jgi:hypothetical protein
MFKPTPVSEQKEAIDFLLNNGFSVLDYLTRKDIVSRIGMHGIAEKLSEHQQQLLHSMLNKQTANRLLDLEATGYNTLPLHEMVGELRQGIFEELDSKNPEINIHRRNLQRAFVDRLISFQEDDDLSNDLQAVARGNLMKLQKSLQAHIRKDGEGVVYYHIIDLNNMIEEALNVKE